MRDKSRKDKRLNVESKRQIQNHQRINAFVEDSNKSCKMSNVSMLMIIICCANSWTGIIRKSKSHSTQNSSLRLGLKMSHEKKSKAKVILSARVPNTTSIQNKRRQETHSQDCRTFPYFLIYDGHLQYICRHAAVTCYECESGSVCVFALLFILPLTWQLNGNKWQEIDENCERLFSVD